MTSSPTFSLGLLLELDQIAVLLILVAVVGRTLIAEGVVTLVLVRLGFSTLGS